MLSRLIQLLLLVAVVSAPEPRKRNRWVQAGKKRKCEDLAFNDEQLDSVLTDVFRGHARSEVAAMLQFAIEHPDSSQVPLELREQISQDAWDRMTEEEHETLRRPLLRKVDPRFLPASTLGGQLGLDGPLSRNAGP